MGNKLQTASPHQEDPAPLEAARLRTQVIAQAPSVYITLVSVLIGLVMSDLVTEARVRMHLWPLNYLAIRTWAQLVANGTSALNVWTVLAHLAMARRRVPDLIETVGAFGAPVLLLVATSFVGRAQVWPWLYGAGVYLTMCGIATTINVRLTMDQSGGSRFQRLVRLRGFLGALYACSAAYLVVGFLDQQGVLPSAVEMTMVFAPLPASVLIVGLFFRDWRAALEDPGSPPIHRPDTKGSLGKLS